ncbi:MAG: DUF4136 domain-containing protein [Bacteroidota bacterium]
MKKHWFLILPFVLGACFSQPDLAALVENMVVQTSVDPSINFSSYSTYTMPLDTIGLVSNTSNANAIVSSYSKMITAEVKKNLDARNFQRVSLSQSPDFGVNIYVVNDVSVFQSVSYGGFGYPGYGYGSYYGYRGYYNYPYVSTYVSSQALLILEIADLKNNVGNNSPKVIWSANIGDVITSVDPGQKVIEAITQAFKQSEYLKK